MTTEEISINTPPEEEKQEASAAIIDDGDDREEEFTPVESLEPLADVRILAEDDEDELAYRSQVSEDDENDPYTDISSMSEEGGEHLTTEMKHGSMDSSLVLNLQSSGSAGNNSNNNSNINSSSEPSDPKTHLLQLQFSRSNSTSSSKHHDRNNSTNSNTLECVADPHIPPHSPIGSATSIASNGSPTAGQKQLPRFYDSEEEGAGSLVFVGDNASLARVSPKALPMGGMFLRSSNSSEDGGGSVVRVPPKELRRPPGGTGDAPALLPYNVRKKLNAPPPPVAPAPSPGSSPVLALGDGKRNHQDRPPMIPPPPQLQPPSAQAPGSAKSKYKVAAIPMYKGRKGRGRDRDPSAASDTGSDTGGEGGEGGGRGGRRMRKVKSSPGTTAPNGDRGRRSSHDRDAGGNDNAPNTSPDKALSPRSLAERERGGDKARPPRPRAHTSSHDVIDPGYSSKDPPPSPRSGSYHIRISSQGSVSSLGSDGAGAGADSDAGNLNHLGMGAPHGPSRLPPHPKSNPNHYHYDQYGMQQQHPQQHPQYQQQHQPHHAPHPQGSRGGTPPSVNYNDVLAQEVAHFLHGEQIARQADARAPPLYPHGPPPHWGPGHGPPHGYAPHGYGPPNMYHPHYQGGPGGYQIEPQAPPMMQYHPNMQWGRRREPCHSISEDDWEETLAKLNAEEGEQGDPEAEYNQGRSRQQRGRGQQQQRLHQLNREQQFQRGPPRGRYDQRPHYEQQDQRMNHYPQLPSSQGGNQYDNRRYSSGQQSSSDGRRGRHRSTASGGREDFASETTGLLPSAGIRTYESRDGRPDMYQMGMDPAWGGGRQSPQQQQQLYHHHGHQGPSTTPQGDSKKKRSKRRRREKEKRERQRLYSDDTDEDDSARRGRHHHHHHHHAHHGSKSSKKKGRRHRKRRSGGPQSNPQDESLTGESYGESTGFSGGRSDRSGSVIKIERQGNFLTHFLLRFKLLVCNLPLSFAAISFSVVLLGVVWLKWAEEALPSCKEVTFHSSQCAYPEFPGCYFCDEDDRRYALAAQFRQACGYVAGASVMLFFAKAVLCWRAFIDEMSSPTTASPSGLIFMTMALSFVGEGDVGAMLVVVASFLHLVLVVWFIYMSMAYGTMTDPSWFANTIGIGLCAVKIWFYYPLSGHFLIAITLIMTFLFYPICLIRVALNEKMSATICWINMMGPAVPLYALAIIMQPSFQEERPDISNFQTVQRSIYLPSMTFLFVLCVVGMASSVHGLISRWKQIASEEFSPAHAAYSFPLLMHALAVQSYRSSLDFFADPGEVSPHLATALRLYWKTLVIAGTLAAAVCIVAYLVLLPSWVDVKTRDEIEPPEPNDTSISRCGSLTYGESLIQPYVSPTILQANETGVVVMTYDPQNGWCDLVRTLRVPAFGFEPMMPRRAFRRERDALKLFMGGQDVILEGDEDGDDIIFDNEIERAMEEAV